MDFIIKKDVGNLAKDREIVLDVCVTPVSLYSTILRSYGIVIGMN